MSTPKVSIAITADDKTARGLNAAEKRAERTIGRIGKTADSGMASTRRSIIGGGRSLIRTFAQVEQAGARAFGGDLLSGGGSLIGRLGALR